MNKRRSDGKRDAPYWEQARACAYCDSVELVLIHTQLPGATRAYYHVACECGALGPQGETRADAISAHNSRVSDKPSAAVEKYVRLRRKLEKE